MLEEFQVKIDVKLPDQKGGTLRRLSALAEKFHKRMKKNFCVMAEEYRHKIEDYPRYFRICAALTNYHISLYPLKTDK